MPAARDAAGDSLAVGRAFAEAVRRDPVGYPFSVTYSTATSAPWADTARALLARATPREVMVRVLWNITPQRLQFAVIRRG